MDDNTTPRSDGDWLAPTPELPADTLTGPSAPRPRARWISAAALVGAGVIVGGGVTLAVAHAASDATTPVSTTGASAIEPGARDGGTGQLGGRFPHGGIDGEQRLQGTLTAVGSSTVTVETSGGTQTYEVTDMTEIVKNGAPATLAQLTAGETVFVHVYPSTSGGQLLVERLFAGTLRNDDDQIAPPDDASDSESPTTTT